MELVGETSQQAWNSCSLLPPCPASIWPAFLDIVMEIIRGPSAAFPRSAPLPGTDDPSGHQRAKQDKLHFDLGPV